jgi:hypothetical protein
VVGSSQQENPDVTSQHNKGDDQCRATAVGTVTNIIPSSFFVVVVVVPYRDGE